jgi:hypothetical protein
MLALTLAVFLQFHFGGSALHVHFRAVVPITARFAFKPDIFSFLRFRHRNKTSLIKHSDLSVKTTHRKGKKVPCRNTAL